MCYLLFRWNANGANPEREAASVRELGAHEWWAKAVTKAMPSVESWEQERWDIVVAPYSVDVDDDDGRTGARFRGHERDTWTRHIRFISW